MNNSTEKVVWKDVVGYEGLYKISSAGEAWSEISKKTLKLSDNRRYYRAVSLYKNGRTEKYLVHRLVAMAFLANDECKETVNHIDGNKINNNVLNLEWSTQKENNEHAYKTGLHRITEEQINVLTKNGKQYGEKAGKRNAEKNGKPVIAVNNNDGEIRKFSSISEASRALNASPGNISNSLKNGYTVKGYKFYKHRKG